MAKLSYKERQKLPDSSFAIIKRNPDGSKERDYPIHNRLHGSNALSRVSAFGTPEEKTVVKRKVCRRYPDLPSCRRPRYD